MKQDLDESIYNSLNNNDTASIKNNWSSSLIHPDHYVVMMKLQDMTYTSSHASFWNAKLFSNWVDALSEDAISFVRFKEAVKIGKLDECIANKRGLIISQ